MNRSLVIATFAASCLVAPAPGQIVQRELMVGHADLDLSRPRDLARFDRRIERSAAQLCGPTFSFDLEGRNEAARCAKQAALAARAQRDRVVALYGSVQQTAAR